MSYLLPCLLVAAPTLGLLAGLRLVHPSQSRLCVVAFALLAGLVSALTQHYGLALTIVLSGISFFAASDFQSRKLRAGRVQYRFCPSCGTGLKQRDFEGHAKLACPSCSFVYWNNPIVVGVALIPSLDGKSIVLVERGLDPKKGFYCLPGGFGETSEHPRDTAKREAGEEVSLDVEIDRLLAVHTAPGGNQVLLFYLTKPTDKNPVRGSDAKSAAFFPLDQLPDNIAFSTHMEVIAAWKQECDSKTK